MRLIPALSLASLARLSPASLAGLCAATLGAVLLGCGADRATVVSPVTVAEAVAATPAPRVRTAKVVILDPGHGGDEIGAATEGLREKDSNLDFALRIERLLRQSGVEVVLTRRDEERATTPDGVVARDGRADLAARVRTANAAEGDLFVSIHSNGSGDTGQRGVEAYYDSRRPFAEQSSTLARALIDGAVDGLAAAGFTTPDRGVLDSKCWRQRADRCFGLYVLSPEGTTVSSGSAPSGSAPSATGTVTAVTSTPTTVVPTSTATATQPPAIVTKEATAMPGVLLELLFLSNDADVAILKSDTARDAIARGVATAILRQLGV